MGEVKLRNEASLLKILSAQNQYPHLVLDLSKCYSHMSWFQFKSKRTIERKWSPSSNGMWKTDRCRLSRRAHEIQGKVPPYGGAGLHSPHLTAQKWANHTD